jgi:hypothetical protein
MERRGKRRKALTMEDGKQDEKSGFSSSMAFSRNERF